MYTLNLRIKKAATPEKTMGYGFNPLEKIWFYSKLTLDIKKEFDRFSSRLDTFMSLSDAVIVAPGGIGTLLELFYSWQLAQVHHICETPIILYGDIWATLTNWLRTEVLAKGFFDSKDMHNIFHVTSVDKVVNFIRIIHKDRSRMEHVCVNYNKYRVEFE